MENRLGIFLQGGIVLCLIQMLFQRASQLVGAGGGLESATDAAKTLNGLLGGHSLDQSGNALGVAGTSAEKLDRGDHVSLQLDVDLSGADSLGIVYDFFHNDSFPLGHSFISRSKLSFIKPCISSAVNFF